MASLLLGLEPVIELGDLTVLRKGRLAFSSHLIRAAPSGHRVDCGHRTGQPTPITKSGFARGRRWQVRLGTLLPIALIVAAMACGDSTPPPFEIARETVQPGTSVNRKGVPMALFPGSFEIGATLEFSGLSDGQLESYSGPSDDRVAVVSIVPSLDTPVCDAQTHALGETETLDANVQRITISRDLPMAQKRFASSSGLTQITYLSDYKSGDFGKRTGLLMKDLGLLSRAVIVLDTTGKVRHYQVVPEITQLPDMEAAFSIANDLVTE
jgi:thiol peroxidase